MPRYIDSDDTIYELERAFPADDFGKIIRCISRTPTADVVDVVRCKDCKWFEREQPGMVYCPDRVGGWVSEDFFCKDGTPKKPKKKQIPTAMIVFEGEAIVELYADKKKIIEALKKLEEEADE